MTLTLDDAVLEALDFDPHPACEWRQHGELACGLGAVWRITCRICGWHGHLCSPHLIVQLSLLESVPLTQCRGCLKVVPATLWPVVFEVTRIGRTS